MQSHFPLVKMKLSLCSFNVGGLYQKIKREQILPTFILNNLMFKGDTICPPPIINGGGIIKMEKT